MIDPFAIVRAVATLAAAVVLGSGVLVWYTRDALAPAGKSVWRRRVVLSVVVAAFAGAVATGLGTVGAAADAAGSATFSVNGTVLVPSSPRPGSAGSRSSKSFTPWRFASPRLLPGSR